MLIAAPGRPVDIAAKPCPGEPHVVGPATQPSGTVTDTGIVRPGSRYVPAASGAMAAAAPEAALRRPEVGSSARGHAIHAVRASSPASANDVRVMTRLRASAARWASDGNGSGARWRVRSDRRSSGRLAASSASWSASLRAGSHGCDRRAGCRRAHPGAAGRWRGSLRPDAGPLPTSSHRRAVEVRPGAGARPRRRHLLRLRRRGRRGARAGGRVDRERPRSGGRRRDAARRRWARGARRRDRARRRGATGHAAPRRARRTGGLHARDELPRRAERPAARLLPLDLHRRRRHAHDRDDAVRGGRRPPRVPVLGRARPQGGLRRHPRGARGHRGAVERSGGRPRANRRWPGAGAVRRHDVDVDVPGGVRRGPSRADRAPRRRRRALAHRAPARQGPPGALRPRRRRVLAAVLQRLLRHPLPRSQGRLRGPARLRARGDGEHRAASPTASRCCSSTPSTRRSPSSRTSPTWSRTSSPINGSATSSRCAGGTASG